jgi:hypothetical protein
MGGNGPGRVYDSIYNPLPSNPSGSSAVVYYQNYNIPSINATSPIVNNSNIPNNFVILKNIAVNNYDGAGHYVLTINNITGLLTNFASSNFYLDLALVSNRNGVLTAITQSDLNKNFSIPRFSQTSYVDGAFFSIENITIEFYDGSGINNLMLVAYSFGISAPVVFTITSIDMNVRCDNLTYNILSNITS